MKRLSTFLARGSPRPALARSPGAPPALQRPRGIQFSDGESLGPGVLTVQLKDVRNARVNKRLLAFRRRKDFRVEVALKGDFLGAAAMSEAFVVEKDGSVHLGQKLRIRLGQEAARARSAVVRIVLKEKSKELGVAELPLDHPAWAKRVGVDLYQGEQVVANLRLRLKFRAKRVEDGKEQVSPELAEDEEDERQEREDDGPEELWSDGDEDTGVDVAETKATQDGLEPVGRPGAQQAEDRAPEPVELVTDEETDATALGRATSEGQGVVEAKGMATWEKPVARSLSAELAAVATEKLRESGVERVDRVEVLGVLTSEGLPVEDAERVLGAVKEELGAGDGKVAVKRVVAALGAEVAAGAAPKEPQGDGQEAVASAAEAADESDQGSGSDDELGAGGRSIPALAPGEPAEQPVEVVAASSIDTPPKRAASEASGARSPRIGAEGRRDGDPAEPEAAAEAQARRGASEDASHGEGSVTSASASPAPELLAHAEAARRLQRFGRRVAAVGRQREEERIRADFAAFKTQRLESDPLADYRPQNSMRKPTAGAPSADDVPGENSWRDSPTRDPEIRRRRRAKARLLLTRRADAVGSTRTRLRPPLHLRGDTPEEQREVVATAFQALWRARVVRRSLRRRAQLALHSQSIVRGFLARQRARKLSATREALRLERRIKAEHNRERRKQQAELDRLAMTTPRKGIEQQLEEVTQKLEATPLPARRAKDTVKLGGQHGVADAALPEDGIECYAALKAKLAAPPLVEGSDPGRRLAELQRRMDRLASERRRTETQAPSSRDTYRQLLAHRSRALSLLQRAAEPAADPEERTARLERFEASLAMLSHLPPLSSAVQPILPAVKRRLDASEKALSGEEDAFLDRFGVDQAAKTPAVAAHAIAIKALRPDRPWWAAPLPEDVTCLPVDIRRVAQSARTATPATDDEASLWWFALARRDEVDLLPSATSAQPTLAPELRRLFPNTRAVGRLLYDRVALGSHGLDARTEQLCALHQRQTSARAQAILALAKQRRDMDALPKEIAELRRRRQERERAAAVRIQKRWRGMRTRRLVGGRRAEQRVFGALATLLQELQTADASAMQLAPLTGALARFRAHTGAEAGVLQARDANQALPAKRVKATSSVAGPGLSKRASPLLLSRRPLGPVSGAQASQASPPARPVAPPSGKPAPSPAAPPQPPAVASPVAEAELTVSPAASRSDEDSSRHVHFDNDEAEDAFPTPVEAGAAQAMRPSPRATLSSVLATQAPVPETLTPEASVGAGLDELASLCGSDASSLSGSADRDRDGDGHGHGEREPRDAAVQRVQAEVHSHSGRFDTSRRQRWRSVVEQTAKEVGRSVVVALLRTILRRSAQRRPASHLFDDLRHGKMRVLRPADIELGFRRVAAGQTGWRLYPNGVLDVEDTTAALMAALDKDGDGVVSLDDLALTCEESVHLPEPSAALGRLRAQVHQRAALARSSDEDALLAAFARKTASTKTTSTVGRRDELPGALGLAELRDGFAELHVVPRPDDLDCLFLAAGADAVVPKDRRVAFRSVVKRLLPPAAPRSRLLRRARTLLKRDGAGNGSRGLAALMASLRRKDRADVGQVSVRAFAKLVAQSEVLGGMGLREATALGEELQHVKGVSTGAGFVRYGVLEKLVGR